MGNTIVLFEVTVKNGRMDDYLKMAGSLKESLANAEGFIRAERFSSLATGCCFCILRSHLHSTAEAMAIAEVLTGACRYLEWPVFLHVVRTVSEWLACQKFTLRKLQIPVHYWRTQGLFNEHFT